MAIDIPAPELTAREIEVIRLAASGSSSRQLAAKLELSKRTIDFHLSNIYDKLRVHNRIQAIMTANAQGLLAGVAWI